METEYRQPRYSEREWLEIFPEAEPRIKELIQGYAGLAGNLAKDIWESLAAIKKIKSDEFSNWFCEEIIRIWKIEPYDFYSGKIKRLKSAFEKPNNSKNRISEEQILRAKAYPVKLLLPVNQMGYAKCPFHADKFPSLFTKDYFYCFGCGFYAHDNIEFVMKRDNCSFPDAVKKLS